MRDLVFMTGPPRSVTSWRTHAINHSPDMLMLHEVNLAGVRDDRLGRARGYYLNQLSDALKKQPLPEYKEYNFPHNNPDLFCQWARQKMPQDLSVQRKCVFFSEMAGNFSVFGDKDPLYLNNIKMLYEQFDSAKFIFCLRNPFHVARSMYCPHGENNEWWQTDDPNKAGSQTLKYFRKMEDFLTLEKSHRCLFWRAESLHSQPRKSWKRVFDFLNINPGNIINFHDDDFNFNCYHDEEIEDLVKPMDSSLVTSLNSIASIFGYPGWVEINGTIKTDSSDSIVLNFGTKKAPF